MMNKMNLTSKTIILTLIILVVGIFSLNIASAVAEDLTFKQWDTVDIKLPCSYKGANCAATAICNISVTFPNGTFMVENKPMTNTGNGMPNYTLPTSGVIGEHNYKQTCTQSGLSADDSGVITITTTGIGSNNKIPIFLIIFAVTLLIFGIILEQPTMGFFSGILFLMVGMYLMIYGFGDIADLYTQAFALIIIALGIIITIMAGFSWMDDYD